MKNMFQIKPILYGLLFIAFSVKSFAQMQCAPGYEARQVKCRNSFVVQCLPTNYSCKQCWTVEFEPCPGRKMGGMSMANSYEQALKAARNESSNWKNGECVFYDNTQYKIYLDDPNQCFSAETKDAIRTDLRNNILAFLQRYREEIANYRRAATGREPRVGATIREYENVFDNAETHVRNLESALNRLTNQNLSEVRQMLKDTEKEAEILRSNWDKSFEPEKPAVVSTRGSAFYFFLTTSMSNGQAFEKPTDVFSAPIEYVGSVDDDFTKFKKDFVQKLSQQLPASTGVRNLISSITADQITIVFTKPYSTTLLRSAHDCNEAINKYIEKVKKDNDVFPELTPNFYKLK